MGFSEGGDLGEEGNREVTGREGSINGDKTIEQEESSRGLMQSRGMGKSKEGTAETGAEC